MSLDEFLMYAAIRIVGKAPWYYGDKIDFQLWNWNYQKIRNWLIEEDFPIN